MNTETGFESQHPHPKYIEQMQTVLGGRCRRETGESPELGQLGGPGREAPGRAPTCSDLSDGGDGRTVEQAGKGRMKNSYF